MKLALLGYGKMGQAIEAVARQRGHEIPVIIDQHNLDQFTEGNLRAVDAAIEFTGPESVWQNVEQCLRWKVPVVVGSTGWNHRFAEAEALCLQLGGSLLYTSNFSVGVNVFFEINRRLAGLMKGHAEYDVQILEVHHTQKKDAPSGTAISLAEQILESGLGKKRWLNSPSDQPEDLYIRSERIDPAPGTHVVTYDSLIDSIEIRHTAHNRTGFALGAVLAAEYIAGKQGVFTMKDVLGI